MQGTQSTRDAVGARVIVTAGGVDQLREQNGGYHRWAQNDRRLHFGLKNNSLVDIVVYWPSGLVSSFDNIAANKLYRIVEGSGMTVVQPGVKIRNHEDVPVMSIADVTVNEEDATATILVSLSAVSARTVVGRFSTENLSASAGEDYSATNGSVEFPAGQVDALITINLIGDSLSEGDEYFEVRMNTVSNSVIGSSISEVTIVDNEGGTPVLLPSMFIDDVSVDENAGAAEFTVSLSQASASIVQVNYITQDGTAQSGSDYAAQTGVLTFNAGQLSQIISISVESDAQIEGEEIFQVILSSVTNALLGDAEGTGVITENAGSGLPEMSISDVTQEEAAGSMKFTVSLSESPTKTVNVNYTTLEETALSGADYNTKTGALTFKPGQKNKIVYVYVKNDTQSEGDETFRVLLSNATNTLLVDEEAVGTILASDGGGVTVGLPEMRISDVTQEEAAGSMKFTVSLSESPTKTVNVNYTTLEETALSGADYNTKTGTLTFKPGQKNKIVYVYVKNDTQSEGDETFRVLLSNATNAVLVDEEAVGTILASDGGGVTVGLPEMSISDVTQEEAAGSMKFTVSLSESPTKTVNVNYTTLEETALSGADYNTKIGTLTFKPGQKDKIVYVYVKNDTQSEGDETFRVLLSNATNALLVDEEAVGTILASDGGGVTVGLPEMRISDVTQEEAAGSMKFTVSLSESPTKTVNVNYTTLEETALSGADYNTKTGTLTFKPGQKNKIVYVYVKNDTQSEGDETFRVLLSNATNAVLVDEEAVGTILASDGGSGGTVSAVVCGKPAYTATGEQAVYFYKDCGTNRWHQRVTGGGGSKAFRGNIQSTHTLSGKVGFSIEANDTLTLSNKRVDYVMKVGAGGQDGVDFTLNVNAQTCVTQKAPLGGAIYVGKNRQRMGDRFVLETLANCQ